MKIIQLKQNNEEITFKLDVDDEITVKQLRKIQPIILKREKEGTIESIDTVIELVKALSDDDKVEEKINKLNLNNFNILTEKIANILNSIVNGNKKK